MGYKLADEVAINAPKATPPRDLLALIAIARRINDHTRTGWLTREEIAHWARIDVRSVKAMRERLVGAGLLVVLETGGGRRKATVFYIPPMPGYLPGQSPRPLDLELEAGPSDFPVSGSVGSTHPGKGGSPDFPLSPVDNAVDNREGDQKGGSPGFPVSETERGKSGPERGKFGSKRGKSGLPPNPPSTPHYQSSSSYGAEEEGGRPAADHPEEEDEINEEDENTTASRAAQVITKRIGCPLDEAERIAHVIARENRIRKPLHIYVQSIPTADLRAWQETTLDHDARQQNGAARTRRPAGRCTIHYQDLPCIGCAADAKALPV
jgi:hypothetical protein